MTAGLAREPDDAGPYWTGPVPAWEPTLRAARPHTRYTSFPGTEYSCSNIGYAILGAALARAAVRRVGRVQLSAARDEPHAIRARRGASRRESGGHRPAPEGAGCVATQRSRRAAGRRGITIRGARLRPHEPCDGTADAASDRRGASHHRAARRAPVAGLHGCRPGGPGHLSGSLRTGDFRVADRHPAGSYTARPDEPLQPTTARTVPRYPQHRAD
jgi:hypothetical protein